MHPAGPEMLRGRDDIELIHIERDAAGKLLTTEQRIQEMQAQVADADLLVMRMTPLQADTVAMAKRLQAVSWHGVGFDPVDVAALKARGIPLLLPGSANSTAVAEQTMMHMLGVARKAKEYDAAARAGDHNIRDTNSLISLEGKTVLIVGFGRVGTRVAKRWCDRQHVLFVCCVCSGLLSLRLVWLQRCVRDEDHHLGSSDTSPCCGRAWLRVLLRLPRAAWRC